MRYEDFHSNEFRKIWCRDYKTLDDNFSGYVNHKTDVIVFLEKCSNYEEYLGKYSSTHFHYLSQDEYNIIKNSGIKHTKKKHYHTYIYYFDDEYFKLNGKKYRNVRNAINKYQNKIVIKEKCNNKDEMFNLLKLWKKQRKEKYFMFSTSFDEYFLKNYFNENDYISHFYYDNDVLVGYSIYERLENGLFNSFYRKSNMDYKHLSEFVDYKSCESVHKKYGNFYLNIGDDGRDPKMKKYKTSNFNVLYEFDLYNVVIDKEQLKQTTKQLF